MVEEYVEINIGNVQELFPSVRQIAQILLFKVKFLKRALILIRRDEMLLTEFGWQKLRGLRNEQTTSSADHRWHPIRPRY